MYVHVLYVDRVYINHYQRHHPFIYLLFILVFVLQNFLSAQRDKQESRIQNLYPCNSLMHIIKKVPFWQFCILLGIFSLKENVCTTTHPSIYLSYKIHTEKQKERRKILSYFLFLLNDFITIYTKPSVRLPTKNFTLTKLHPTKSSASMLSLTVLLLVEHAIFALQYVHMMNISLFTVLNFLL